MVWPSSTMVSKGQNLSRWEYQVNVLVACCNRQLPNVKQARRYHHKLGGHDPLLPDKDCSAIFRSWSKRTIPLRQTASGDNLKVLLVQAAKQQNHQE
jgi:hypothetical protein